MKRLSMKFITVILSCIVLMLNVVPIASAGGVNSTDSDSLANRLYAFGLINNSVLNSEKSVTRAEAAYTFCKMMGYTSGIKSNQKTIDDISGNVCENEIYQVVDAGLMSCLYDNSFKPDVAVNYGDVASAVVRLLGYNRLISDNADAKEYISMYMRYVGNTVKGENSDVKWSEFIRIINESIEAGIVDMTVDDDRANFAVSKDKTILSERLKIKKYRGVVTATEFSDLYGKGKVGEGYLKINDNIFTCNEAFTADLLGVSVDAWVWENSDTGEEIIKYIDKNNADDGITTIKSSDIESLTTKKLEYSFGSKTRVINLPNGIYVLYNGIAVPNYSGVSLSCNQGMVYVIDYNNDGQADVLSIFNYDKAVVKSIDSDGNIVDLHHKNRNIRLKDSDVKVYKNGILSSKDEINKNDVLSVLKDTEGNPIIAIVNISTVSGRVAAVRSSDENGCSRKLVINDMEFSVDSTFDSLTNYEWEKANGVFFLDYNGVIVGYKQSGYEYEYGYIIKIIPDSVEEAVAVKLLNSDSVIKTLYMADKVTINGSRYKTYGDVSSEMLNHEREIVRYRIDGDNKLNIIETSQNGDSYENADSVSEGKLRMTYSSGDSKFPYINATGMISDKAKVGSNTIFFEIPDGESEFDESLYSARLGAPMYDGENVKFKTYSVSSQRICDDVCVIYTDGNYNAQSFDESSPVGVIEDIFKSVDSDDEIKTTITVCTKDGSVTVMESNYGYFKSVTGADGTTGLSLQCGDVVRYLTDHKGQVPYITVLSRVDETGALHTYNTGGGIVDKFFFKSGYLYKRDDTQIVLVGSVTDITRDKWSVLDIKSNKVFVCQNIGTSKFSVQTGSVDDMNGYVETKEAYPVAIHMTYGQPKLIVIYK